MKNSILILAISLISLNAIAQNSKIINKKYDTFVYAPVDSEFENEMSFDVTINIYNGYRTFSYETSTLFASGGTFIFTNGKVIDEYRNSDEKKVVKVSYLREDTNELVNIYFIDNLNLIIIEYKSGKYNKFYNS